MSSGLWFVIKNFPGLISEGFRLATDSPRIPKIRFDPEGENKAEERHKRSRE